MTATTHSQSATIEVPPADQERLTPHTIVCATIQTPASIGFHEWCAIAALSTDSVLRAV